MIVELDAAPVFVGEGSGRWQAGRPVLLLVHGAGMDRTVWVLLARWFARHGFDVVAPDLPAHGGSGGEPLRSVEAMADWTWRLLDVLRAEHGLSHGPLVLAGHSMGALVAVAMAGARPGPDELARLVLLGAGYPMAVGAPLLAAAAANEHAAIDMIAVYGHAHASRLGRNTVAGISVVNSAMALLERAAPGVLHTDLAACDAWSGAEAAAAGVGAGRAGIVAGAEDRMTPMRGTRRLAELLGAAVAPIAGCGHMMMSERPDETLAAMRDAIGDPRAPAPPGARAPGT